MLKNGKIRMAYERIQSALFYMIPEKWDKIYLYASITEGINNLQTGEMYFYYFPKGILKKEPINVYEVPNKFNIDDTKYFKLADELYGVIKKLRKEYININDEAWSNIIIFIENFKFKVEYGFEDLNKSQYNSYDRHILFRYMYLNTSINMYNRKERNMIESYLRGMNFKKEKKQTYIEPIYNIDKNNIIDYQKEDEEVPADNKMIKVKEHKYKYNYNYEINNNYNIDYAKKEKTYNNFNSYKNIETNNTNNLDEVVKLQVKQVIEENREESKNQILNFTNINNKNSY